MCVPPGLAEGARWHRAGTWGPLPRCRRLPVGGHPSAFRGTPQLWAGGGCAARRSRLFLAGGGGERAAALKLASLFCSTLKYPAGPILLFFTGNLQHQPQCPGSRSSRGPCDRSRAEPGAAGRFSCTDSPSVPKMDEGYDASLAESSPLFTLSRAVWPGQGLHQTFAHRDEQPGAAGPWRTPADPAPVALAVGLQSGGTQLLGTHFSVILPTSPVGSMGVQHRKLWQEEAIEESRPHHLHVYRLLLECPLLQAGWQDMEQPLLAHPVML